MASKAVLSGLNVPVPPDHIAEVALPPITPASCTFGVVAQMVYVAPASTVAEGFTVMV